jgi:hypothetical protein
MGKIKTQNIQGVTYVFERTSFRVPGDPKVHQKRQYLGKFHANGDFIPNNYFLSLDPEQQKKTGLTLPTPKKPKPGRPAEEKTYTRLFYGATYVFDHIAHQLQVSDDLKTCFPDLWKKILSVAWFLILEERNSLSRFPKWAKTHKHPYNAPVPSPRSSELFAAISEDSIQQFFSCQVKRRIEAEYLAYDTTYTDTVKIPTHYPTISTSLCWC